MNGVPRYWIYLIVKPGHDLDGEDTSIRAETRKDADKFAELREAAWACKLRFAGERVHGQIKWELPDNERPAWAREVA
jgi:hypothetical protein